MLGNDQIWNSWNSWMFNKYSLCKTTYIKPFIHERKWIFGEHILIHFTINLNKNINNGYWKYTTHFHNKNSFHIFKNQNRLLSCLVIQIFSSQTTWKKFSLNTWGTEERLQNFQAMRINFYLFKLPIETCYELLMKHDFNKK